VKIEERVELVKRGRASKKGVGLGMIENMSKTLPSWIAGMPCQIFCVSSYGNSQQQELLARRERERGYLAYVCFFYLEGATTDTSHAHTHTLSASAIIC